MYPASSSLRFIVGLRHDHARAERGRAVLLRVEVQRAAYQLAVRRDPIFTAGLNKELHLVPPETKTPGNELSGDKVPG